jgi:hypothetical protein
LLERDNPVRRATETLISALDRPPAKGLALLRRQRRRLNPALTAAVEDLQRVSDRLIQDGLIAEGNTLGVAVERLVNAVDPPRNAPAPPAPPVVPIPPAFQEPRFTRAWLDGYWGRGPRP